MGRSMNNQLARLTESVAAVSPIDGVSGSQGSIRVDFKPEATASQKSAAQSVVTSFDWSQAAQDAWLADQYPERKSLRQQAAQAIADNDAYLAISGPTNAQVVAQVRRLTDETTRVIKRLIQID